MRRRLGKPQSRPEASSTAADDEAQHARRYDGQWLPRGEGWWEESSVKRANKWETVPAQIPRPDRIALREQWHKRIRWTWVEFTSPTSLLFVHDALDCSTCNLALIEWKPELAVGARVGDLVNLASTMRDQVLGQSGASTSGNLVTRNAV
ncbi:hypothetical protein Syun_011718 [Stephania yunnanensis]|uniref:Uncharacterized protein n=1 Tax=Stephania yunnanensis TaxID=152371 RepID=A0AAP0JY28_9MAGN